MSVYTPSLEQRLEFAPPKAPGFLPAAILALLAHLLLVAALTWGVQWKNQVDTPAIEAELWSALPQQAAPAAVEPPPLPVPAVPVTPPPPPEPVAKPVPPPPAPDVREAQIALERDRQRAKAEEQRQQALRLAEQKRKDELKQRELEKKAKAEAEALAREKLAKEKLAKEKRDKEREKEELARKREAEQQQAAKAEKADKARQAAAKAEADARHKDQVNRMLGMAGASGDANATGTALRASGPSASYAGRIAARVKPNITFNDDISGNPVAEVEVRVAPDGSVVGTPKLVKSSGNRNWDDAVIKAILKTETLPKDVDGRVQPVIVMGFRPKD